MQRALSGKIPNHAEVQPEAMYTSYLTCTIEEHALVLQLLPIGPQRRQYARQGDACGALQVGQSQEAAS